MTTIAIIGLGNMGKGLASRLAGKTQLVLSSRDLAAAKEFAESLPSTLSAKITVADVETAVAQSDVVVLALPFDAALQIAANAELAGKVVVDISNPVKADYSGLAFGHSTSAAEQIQAAASGAKVVKAYNTVFAQLFALPAEQTANVGVVLAGNDEAAVATIAAIVKMSGFTPESAGSLDAARLIEPMGMLNIRFGYGLGRGTAIAPSWLKLAA